jgi:acetyl-CoA acetyltransferase
MTDAVIVSTARTPIGKAYKGALNNTEGATLLGHAIAAAVSRASIESAEVEDVVMGCAMQQGTTGSNIARRCCAPDFPWRWPERPSTASAPPGFRRSRSRRVR